MSKRRIKTASAPDALNRPGLWWKDLRPYFNVEAFQARINLRVPVNRDGKPVIRLVWGQDVVDRAFGETAPRYWTKRQRIAVDDKSTDTTGAWRYWRVPRWFLERRIEPEAYVPAWEAGRYAMTDVSGSVVDRGDPPADYYLFAALIADHEPLDLSGWPACCTRAFYTDRARCWGKYRAPSDFDLTLISQAVRQMEADKFRDPYAPMSASQLLEAEMMANKQVERQMEQDLQRGREAAADFYGIPLSALPDNWGRRDSGIVVPD